MAYSFHFPGLAEKILRAGGEQSAKPAGFPYDMHGGRVKLQCGLGAASRLRPPTQFGGDTAEQDVIAGVVAVNLMIGVQNDEGIALPTYFNQAPYEVEYDRGATAVPIGELIE